MPKHLIDSQITLKGKFSANWSQDIISNEPMLYNCCREAAWDLGGPITKEFLKNLPEDWQNCDVVVETLVHRLNVGYYAYLPGYHCDDRIGNRVVKEHELIKGLPKWRFTPEPERHTYILSLVNGEIAPTEFAIGKCEVDLPEVDDDYYKLSGLGRKYLGDSQICDARWPMWALHFKVADLVKAKKMSTYFAESGVYIEYSDRTFHQTTRGKTLGFRWYMRIGKNSDPKKDYSDHIYTNEIKNNAQVYVELPKEYYDVVY